MRDAVLRQILQSQGLTRHDCLRLGGAAGLSLGMLPFLWAAKEQRAAEPPVETPGFGKAKSVVLIYASGGQSQLDLWDLKPNAPEEVRGVFKPIATSVPGTMLCEHLPRLAQNAHLYTLVRSLSHDDLDHGSATYLALTGQPHPRKSSNPPAQPTDYPTYGALLQRVRPSNVLPYTAVHVNGPALVPEYAAPGQNAGFLGRACEPLLLGDPTDEPPSCRGARRSRRAPQPPHSPRELRFRSRERRRHPQGAFCEACARR